MTRFDDATASQNLGHVQQSYDRYLRSLPLYRQRLLERYAIVDAARKVVGIGSVGSQCHIVLLESGDGDPLFLQLKEATASVLEPHLGTTPMQPGERVVIGQRLMQAMGDVLLGSSHFESESGERVDFYIRQLWDGKGSADVTRMGGRELRDYSASCGAALALAHARAGDAAMITGYLGKKDTFDEALSAFAKGYADLNRADYSRHRDAIAADVITADSDS